MLFQNELDRSKSLRIKYSIETNFVSVFNELKKWTNLVAESVSWSLLFLAIYCLFPMHNGWISHFVPGCPMRSVFFISSGWLFRGRIPIACNLWSRCNFKAINSIWCYFSRLYISFLTRYFIKVCTFIANIWHHVPSPDIYHFQFSFKALVVWRESQNSTLQKQ